MTTLTAQRATYAARQGALSKRLEDYFNRVSLYQVLGRSGDDWVADELGRDLWE